MANLWTGRVDANDEYQNLETLSGLTFTSGNKYQIQIQNTAWLREGTTGEGFIINNTKPVTLNYKGDDVYIKSGTSGCVVNIAE